MPDPCPEQVLAWLSARDVSRETIEKLDWFVAEFERWTAKINLISPKTRAEFWTRHVLDSAQLCDFLENSDREVFDIGSGGGLPGLVLAILDQDAGTPRHFTSIESDKRKAAFQSHVVRGLRLNAEILSERVEMITDRTGDVVVSRALAPLDKLLEMSAPLLRPGGKLVFLKGKNADQELQSALETWAFSHQKSTSITDDAASVITITAPVRKNEDQ